MNKLLKPVLCMLFIMAIGYKSYGQFRMRVPVHVQRGAPINRVRPNAGKRMELVKESFISQKLNLTADEAKVFWPLYRRYVQDQTAVRILKRQNNSTNSPDGTEQIDKELDYEAQLVEIRKHYKDEFLKILPPEKVSQLYKSERQFNDEAVKILSERSVRAGD
jgi:hypothetical protein